MKKITKILFSKLGVSFETMAFAKLPLIKLFLILYAFAWTYYGYSSSITLNEVQIGIQSLFGLKNHTLNFLFFGDIFGCFLEVRAGAWSHSIISIMNRIVKKIPMGILICYLVVWGILVAFYDIGEFVKIGEVFLKEISLHFIVHYFDRQKRCGFFGCRRFLIKLKNFSILLLDNFLRITL